MGDSLVDETLAGIRAFAGTQYLIEVELEFTAVGEGTFNAARWDSATKALFNVTSSGICANRNIAGTETLSQHAYCNAVDTFASQSELEDIFYFGAANAEAFSIRLLIFHDMQFYRPSSTSGGSFGRYSGIYHAAHVHADFWPAGPF